MSIRQSLAEWLFGDVIEQRVKEASVESDRGWHSIAGDSARDIPFSDHRENIDDCLEAYRSNPLAFRIVELTTDFVLGRGMKLQSKDARAQKWIDKWWNHPLNNLELRQFQLCTELSISGELFLTLHKNPFDGVSYIRAIPAQHVDEIETNPEDIEDELRFHVQSERTLVEGLKRDVAADITGRWWSAEDCHHYAINRPVATVRGQGDLVPELPWLRRYKDWLTDRARINKYKGAFLWDVTLAGASRKQILDRQAELAKPPNPGSVLVHNDSETWNAVMPRIEASDASADGKAMRLMVSTGAGVPLHYLSEGDTSTRTAAMEMGTPTFRHFQRRQLYVGFMFVHLCQSAMRKSGEFPTPPAIAPVFQDISPTDNLNAAKAAATVSKGLADAVANGVINQAEARRLFDRFFRDPLDQA